MSVVVSTRLVRIVCCAGVGCLAFSVDPGNDAYAQSTLPSVTVDAPNRQAVRRPQAQLSARRTQQAPRRVAAQQPQPVQPVPYLTPSTGVLGGPQRPYAGGQVATGGGLG